MPRTARADLGDVCYHVLNRGNARQTVFPAATDYAEFVKLLADGVEVAEMRLLGWCLMPNHVHLALWPRRDGDLGRFMQRLLTAHVRRHHKRHGGGGHLWQGRFKAFPIQHDAHLLAVLRYIERNPLRSGLARRAADWRWSSCAARLGRAEGPSLTASPVPIPEWPRFVEQPHPAEELDRLRLSVNRGAPFGDPRWTARTAERLGLLSTLRPRGRPRKPQP